MRIELNYLIKVNPFWGFILDIVRSVVFSIRTQRIIGVFFSALLIYLFPVGIVASFFKLLSSDVVISIFDGLFFLPSILIFGISADIFMCIFFGFFQRTGLA